MPVGGCRNLPPSGGAAHCRFLGLDKFDNFSKATDATGHTVRLSPVLAAGMDWNELVVSWNVAAPAGTWLQVEARAWIGGRPTRFYNLGCWSPDNRAGPRTSLHGQSDADGTIKVDTLVLAHPADRVQLRLTLGGPSTGLPALKFLGLSFANTRVPPPTRPPNRAAWGKIIRTPERSQYGYGGGQGWCAPASLAMVLAHWADVLHRPELNLPVPVVAAAVYDRDYRGTGNWPFNTALAGGFPGLRAWVARLDGLPDVEDWIAAGVPVILSVRWDQLEDGRPPDANGHLVVCTGFTAAGDVVVNDPAARRGEPVQRIYRRANVLRAWAGSHQTAWLVGPAEVLNFKF